MSDDPEQCSNYLKIIRLLVDIGTKTARDIFYNFKPREKVSSFFGSITICSELFILKRKHIISENQFMELVNNPNPDEFDLSLILALLTNVFTGMIDPPINGWDKGLDTADLSLGADLLRLREFRNAIIGHSVNARIKSEEFEKLWSEIEEVLIRLNKHISDKHELDIKLTLENYKKTCLDPHQGDEKNYVDILQHWCKELREEVDDLWEKTKEFECFFENVPEHYSRYTLLLNEGGNLVLQSVLKREEIKQSKNLVTLLQSNEEQLKEEIKNLDDLLQNFVKGTSNLNLQIWDISSLSFAALSICKLSFLEKDAIETIKRARENYADIALASLDAGKFGSYWGDLKSSLYTLSSGQEEIIQIQCKGLVEKYGKEALDKTAARKLLGQLGEGNGQLKRLLDAYRETSKRLKEVAENMERNGIPFKEDRVITLKMITKGNRQERREVAEDILYTVWQKALDVTGDSDEFPRVKKAVDDILDEIRAMDDVKLAGVTKHCVIVSFKCSTCTGLLDLVAYFDSSTFKDHMLRIDKALSECCDDYIHITSYMTFESMFCVLNQTDVKYPNDRENCIYIPISCKSISGVKHIKQLFDDGNISNFENQVSHALSSETGGEIKVKTELDLRGLNYLFRSSKRSVDTTDSDQTKFDEDKSTTISSKDSNTGDSKFESIDKRVQLIFDLFTRKKVIHVFGMAGIGKSFLMNTLRNELQRREQLCIFKNFVDVEIQSPVIQYQIFQEAFSKFNENTGMTYFNQCFPEGILMCGICRNCRLGLHSFKANNNECLKKTLTLKKAFTALTLCMKICKKEITLILDSTDQIMNCNTFTNFLKATSRLCPYVKIIFASRNYLPLDFEGLEKMELEPLSQKQIAALLYFVTESNEEETKRFLDVENIVITLKPEHLVFTPENRDMILAITHLFNGLPVIASTAGQLLRNSSLTLEDLIEVLIQARLQCLIKEHQEMYGRGTNLMEDSDVEMCDFSDEMNIMIEAFKESVNYTGKSVVSFKYSDQEMEEAAAAIFTELQSDMICQRQVSSTLSVRKITCREDRPSTCLGKFQQNRTSRVQRHILNTVDFDTQERDYERHFYEQKYILPENTTNRKHLTVPSDQTSQADSEVAVVPSLGLTQRNIKRFNFGRLILKSLKIHFKSKLKTILH